MVEQESFRENLRIVRDEISDWLNEDAQQCLDMLLANFVTEMHRIYLGETTTGLLAKQNVELLFDQPMEEPVNIVRDRINTLTQMVQVVYTQVWNALEDTYTYNHYDPFKFEYVGMSKDACIVFKSLGLAWVDLERNIHKQ